jgi:hypothetical protein
LSTHSDDAHRRAEALFKKDQQARKGRQRMAEYQANLDAMREKTARLRALRLARDATNKKRTLPTTKGAAQSQYRRGQEETRKAEDPARRS